MSTSLLRFTGAILFLAAWAGCESDRGPRPKSAPAESAAAIPEMEAHGRFLDGQVETEVLLSRAGFPPRTAAAGGRSGSGGGFRGGMGGGGGGRRGGMGGAGGMAGGRGGEMAGERGGAGSSGDGEPRPQLRASNEAPVRLQLRLTNHGPEPIDIEVTDFNSDLGNFVVQPRRITLPAGGSVEVDPMTSRLGLKADEIPLTVAIRANGHTEKQTLDLHLKPATPVPLT